MDETSHIEAINTRIRPYKFDVFIVIGLLFYAISAAYFESITQ